MVKILVTGVNGFVGKHLVRELVAREINVIGVGIEKVPDKQIAGSIDQYFTCDLTNPEAVNLLPLAEVVAIINLAGFAAVGASFDQAEEYVRVNTAVVTTLCDGLLEEKLNTRMVGISSGAVYDSAQPMPLTEESKTNKASSPYAASKLAMEDEIMRYRDLGLDAVAVRPFNHIGPGQRGGFLVPDVYAKIQEAIKNNSSLKVGDLTTRRDYTDVRDVVKAYVELAVAPTLEHEIYNVCSSKSVDGQTILNILLNETGQKGKLKVEQDPALLRPNDPKDLFGSNERLRKQTGWQPTILLQQTLHDFVASA